MLKTMSLKRLLLVAVLLGSLMLTVTSVFAQDATPAAAEEHSTEAATESSDHSETAAVEGEAAPATSPLTPLGINAGFLIAQIVNFLIIFLILRAVLWGPLRNMLDSRAAKIQKGLEDAQVAANARRNAEAEAETIRTNARAEIAKAIEEGRSRGEEVAKQIEAEARSAAEKIREEARSAAASERDQQLAGLRGQVAAISMAAANKLIGEALDAKRQQALIDDFFAKVPDSAKKLGGSVEVVSAMPLSADEQKKVQKEVGAENVTFSVDPSILGGLIVRSGDRVVDGSVRSGLSELSSRLS
ncbi:MAG: F0F1 ATP synthase subunit B [Anaerolineae bacterium]|nr:F0F1 ATP synthase subunit B [Anaerolineae bacterium]